MPLQELFLAGDPVIRRSRILHRASALRVLCYCSAVGLAVLGALWIMWPDPPAYSAGYVRQGPKSPAPVFRSTATDLYDRYADYEVAAKAGLNAIEISGDIQSVSKNMFDETEINLDAGEGAGAVSLTLDRPMPATSAPLRGSRVSIFCADMTLVLGKAVGQNCRVLNQ